MIEINEKLEVGRSYTPVGLMFISNGCCPGRPVVITRSFSGSYSCQCACGMWCTNGHKTATAAVLEYQHMSKGRGIWDAERIRDKLERLTDAVEGVAAV